MQYYNVCNFFVTLSEYNRYSASDRFSCFIAARYQILRLHQFDFHCGSATDPHSGSLQIQSVFKGPLLRGGGEQISRRNFQQIPAIFLWRLANISVRYFAKILRDRHRIYEIHYRRSGDNEIKLSQDGAMKGRRGGAACLRHRTVYCQQLNNAGAPVVPMTAV